MSSTRTASVGAYIFRALALHKNPRFVLSTRRERNRDEAQQPASLHNLVNLFSLCRKASAPTDVLATHALCGSDSKPQSDDRNARPRLRLSTLSNFLRGHRPVSHPLPRKLPYFSNLLLAFTIQPVPPVGRNPSAAQRNLTETGPRPGWPQRRPNPSWP